MDVWDGTDEEPVIFHGHTLTSKVPLRRVVEAIRTHAFEHSKYPLILCIEVHCSVKQQLTMVDLLRSALGPMLLTPPAGADDLFLSSLDHLPSPEALKNRIIILGRKLAPAVASASASRPASGSSLTITPEVTAGADAAAAAAAPAVGWSLEDFAGSGGGGGMSTAGDVTEDDESAESIKQRNNERPGSMKRIRLARPFSDLIHYCQFRRFKSFAHSAKTGKV